NKYFAFAKVPTLSIIWCTICNIDKLLSQGRGIEEYYYSISDSRFSNKNKMRTLVQTKACKSLHKKM
ncbi:MAG: hypothetical protein KKD21_04330, partial [Proteobacteria bacterium]|nr:hypothetical protein [Pseudomonadota bacterium]